MPDERARARKWRFALQTAARLRQLEPSNHSSPIDETLLDKVLSQVEVDHSQLTIENLLSSKLGKVIYRLSRTTLLTDDPYGVKLRARKLAWALNSKVKEHLQLKALAFADEPTHRSPVDTASATAGDDAVYVVEDKASDRSATPSGTQVILHHTFDGGQQYFTLNTEDLERLDPPRCLDDGRRAFLNDKHINFGLRHHMQSIEANVFVFDSLFSSLLLQPSEGLEASYSILAPWTSRIDVFDFEFIVLPVCSHEHWFFVVVTQPSHLIKVTAEEEAKTSLAISFDSIGLTRKDTIDRLVSFLKEEAKARKKVEEDQFMEPRYISADVPSQPNNWDCGLYLLHYFWVFFEKLDYFIPLFNRGKQGKKEFWEPEAVPGQREKWKKLILDLSKK